MNVLLISANMETMNMPPLPLGLACVAAATGRAGHDVALINLMFEEDANQAIRNSLEGFRPDVIGVSVRNIDDQNMEHPRFFLDSIREVVANCRCMCRAPVILGGAGYSIWTSPGFVDTGSGNNEGPEEVSMSSKRYTPEFRAEAIRQGRLKPAL